MEGINRIMPVNASSFPAPSAAAIAAAVAAPSAATIATAVAAAVPTTAGITSIVQANAGSPYAGSWTYLGYVNGNGTASVSFTGLSSYKYLKLYYNGVGCPSGSTDIRLRFNGNASGYSYFEEISISGGNNYGSSEFNSTALYFPTTNTGATANIGTIEIPQSNSSTAPKIFDYRMTFYQAGVGTQYKQGTGLWVNTGAISSIDLALSNGANFTVTAGTQGGFFMWGGN
jgi:hypothetical protein